MLNHSIHKVISFIFDFENNLYVLWRQPKLFRFTHYVITLDRIAQHGDIGLNMIRRILNHKGLIHQVEDWVRCGIINGGAFDSNSIFVENNGSTTLSPKFEFLPIDTLYFQDIESEITALFSNINDVLDGWLVKGDNWQALNTLLPVFREKVQCIYIDPPFNKSQESDYNYNVKYENFVWTTMLRDRISLSRKFLKESGSIFVRCDYNGNWIVRSLLDDIFGKDNFRNEIVISRISKQDPKVTKFNAATDSLYFFSRSENHKFRLLFKRLKETKGERWHSMDSQGQGKPLYIFGYLFYPPKGRHWTYSQENIKRMEELGRVRLKCRGCGYIHTSGIWRQCPNCKTESDVTVEYLLPPTIVKQVDSNWTDIPGYTSNFGFSTENSEVLLKRVIESTSDEGDWIMDFFLGSGTTTAVAHKLRRKWIGIEMGEHFYSVVLPRMKRVLAYDKSGISKERYVKEKYNARRAGGFFKYSELNSFSAIIEQLF